MTLRQPTTTIVQPSGTRRRVRGWVCRWRGHRWANYGVFMRIKLPDGEWKTVQARKGVEVCGRCRAMESVEITTPPEGTLIDQITVLAP